jgi:hypothetical protein
MRGAVARNVRVREPRIPQPDIRKRAFGCNDHAPCYKLMSTYEYVDEVTFPVTVVLRIPAGFHYDGASIPRLVWSVIDDDDLKLVGPLVHDALYRYGGDLPKGWLLPEERRFYTRGEADYLFKYILNEEGVAEWRENFAWLGVKFGGWASWDTRRKSAWGGR